MYNSENTIVNLTFCYTCLNQTTPNSGREVSFSTGHNAAFIRKSRLLSSNSVGPRFVEIEVTQGNNVY